MSKLKTNINITHHDDLYQMIVELHDGRSEAESQKINAKLIFILMNQIDDKEIVTDAIQLVEASALKWGA